MIYKRGPTLIWEDIGHRDGKTSFILLVEFYRLLEGLIYLRKEENKDFINYKGKTLHESRSIIMIHVQ